MPDILIVDDSEVFVRETVEGLRRRGWNADGVSDGTGAMQILSRKRFDAMVLDRSMPGASGDDVLRWVRKQNRLRDLCVIMLTAYGQVQSAVDALKLGAFQYIEKPIEHLGQLRSILAAGIAWHRAHSTRNELLLDPGHEYLITRVRSILGEALQPDLVQVMFVGPGGEIDGIGAGEGSPKRPRFVERIMAGNPIVFEQEATTVQSLDPILPAAKTLMAVPVPGRQGGVTGVLDMESLAEQAFDPCWGEVLRYFADLVGFALELEKAADVKTEQEKLKQLELLYREFRHSIATHVQIVSMQARELLESEAAMAGDEGSARRRRRLTYIKDNADIVEGVVQDLKAVAAGPPKVSRQLLDVAALVRAVGDSLAPRGDASITMSLPDPGQRVDAEVDRGGLAYCLKCLIQNSIEAIEDARRTALEPRPDTDRIELEVTQSETALQIRVQDTGVGFEPADRDSLFLPLYSTKLRHAMEGARKEVMGAERVERILDRLSKWVGPRLDRDRLAGVGKGVEILIRDGESLAMYVKQGPVQAHVTLADFERTVLDRVSTERSLEGEWPNRGVGLYSAQRIIAAHEGCITAHSDGLGRGATFVITLPKYP